ncbi:MAG: hypothetical protein WDZ88_03655 [Candidatus Paceibacterota bacterium]
MKIFRALGFVLVLIALKLIMAPVFKEFETMLITLFNVVEVLLVSVVQAPFFEL